MAHVVSCARGRTGALTSRTRVATALVLVATVAAGCARGTGSGDAAPKQATPTTAATAVPSPDTTDTSDSAEATTMRIRITVDGQAFGATLRDSAATRDLAAQLPLTLDMADHGGVEKTGPLPEALSTDGEPEGADPEVGAVGYYAPGNDLVLYYGNQSFFPGIVVLGRMDDDGTTRLAGLDGAVTATVEAG